MHIPIRRSAKPKVAYNLAPSNYSPEVYKGTLKEQKIQRHRDSAHKGKPDSNCNACKELDES